MFRNLCALVALTLFLGGCATYPDANKQRMESLPYCYVKFDAVLAWEVKDAGPGMVIDGLLKNNRYFYMEGVEVWVTLRDAAGKTMAREVAFIIPHQLYRDEIAPFTVKLPVSAEPGSKMFFTYKYRGSDGGDDEGEGMIPWIQSFEAKIPGQQ